MLGGDDFLDNIRKESANNVDGNLSLEVILKAVCQVLDISEELVISSGKSQKASFARGAISLIAKNTEKTSTISSLLSRFTAKHLSSPQTQELLEKAKLKAIQIAELQA